MSQDYNNRNNGQVPSQNGNNAGNVPPAEGQRNINAGSPPPNFQRPAPNTGPDDQRARPPAAAGGSQTGEPARRVFYDQDAPYRPAQQQQHPPANTNRQAGQGQNSPQAQPTQRIPRIQDVSAPNGVRQASNAQRPSGQTPAGRTPVARQRNEGRPAPVPAGGRRRGRPDDEEPRRRIGGFFGAILYFAFIVGVSAILAALIWVAANDVLGLVKPDKIVEIIVEDTDTISEISSKLKEKGIIEYPWLFNLYGKFSNAEDKIDPGIYNIDANFDYRAIIYAMSDRSQFRATVWVTIPEGYDLKQIYKLLSDKGICKYEDVKKTADTYPFKHDFLKDVPMRENRLEGFLFPDTYEFYVNEKPVNVLNVMLLAFGDKFTDTLRKRAEDTGFTILEAVTIASLIEKEAAIDDERNIISSVIHNRLSSTKYPRLQIDATIQYFLPERKEKLSTADTEIDNPYNTYLYDGLPPGPIACPGSASIKAALYPEDTQYYFYALDEGGAHKFSKTKDEHDAFLASKK